MIRQNITLLFQQVRSQIYEKKIVFRLTII